MEGPSAPLCYARVTVTTPTAIPVAALVVFTLTAACERKSQEIKREPAQPTERESDAAEPTLPGLDHGLLQSPINILSKQAEGGHHEIAVNLHHADPEYLENKGHTIELDFPSGSSITLDGREYELKQAHFHTPSEHQVDGVTYPMELHVVNMIDPETPDDPPRYLVIAFLYRMGDEDPVITSFLDQVPEDESGEALEPGKVHINEAEMQTGTGDYYHYRGSLTTPPYTETVDWLIQREIVEASPEQIRRIHRLEGDNARHVQALYGRTVDD